MLTELRHFSRVIRRSPTSAIVAVLMLALTVGVATALFALVDAVVLTPPPFADPASLAVLGEIAIGSASAPPRPVSRSTFGSWREYRQVVSAVEAFDPINLTFTGRGPAERVSAMAVTPGFFSLLGVSPPLGRLWSENQSDSDVAVISDAFWRTRLGTDPNVLGSAIVLGGRSHAIVGVLSKQFTFGLSPSDIWVPLRRVSSDARDGGPPVRVLGRIVPGASAAEAALTLDEVSRRATPPRRAVALPIAGAIAGSLGTIVPLLLLGALVAIALAVINLTGLLVVRAMDRQREFAIRRALGASATRLAKQLLIEAHVLIALGTIGGILIARWITPMAGSLALQEFGSAATSALEVSWRTITILGLAVWPCAWLCGLTVSARALRARGGDLFARSAAVAPRELALRRLLVAAEIALAFVLLASLAVVGRSLRRALTVDPGFDTDQVLTAGVSLPSVRYPDPPHVAAFYRNLDGALSERLGRDHIAIVDELPLLGNPGRSLAGAHQGQVDRESIVRVVGPGYFDVMQIPIVDGRGFAGPDDQTAPARVVIDQTLARELFGDSRSAGRRIWVAALGQMAEIVGVAKDVKNRALDEPAVSNIYLSAWQQPSATSRLVIRSSARAPDALATLRAEVERLDRELPVYGVRPMQDIVHASPGMPTRRIMAACFLAFAVLAVVVAGLGIFGIVTHDLARRRHELALRLALGANPAQLRSHVLGGGAALVAAGTVPGVLLAAAASRLLQAVLADIDTTDPAALAGVAAVLFLVAGVAIAGPARRATRIDPALVLRGD